jgi:hypothetical protein
MTIRMFATPLAAALYDNPNGLVLVPPPPAPAQRAYTSTPGTPIDVPGDMTGDAAVLVNTGYVAIGLSGMTVLRPPTSNLKPGTIYVDTTLAIVVFWDGANWRNVVMGVIA